MSTQSILQENTCFTINVTQAEKEQHKIYNNVHKMTTLWTYELILQDIQRQHPKQKNIHAKGIHQDTRCIC